MTLEDPARVGIDHEGRPASRVQQDAVCRLFTDPGDAQESPPRIGEIPAEHPFEVPAEIPAEHLEKGLQPPCLDAEVAGGPDTVGQNVVIESVKSARLQQTFRLEPSNGLLDVEPVGVLRQDGPHGDLEGRLAGPPVQVAEKPIQRLVDADKPAVPAHRVSPVVTYSLRRVT